jgi:hypothetical protein
MFRRMSDSTLDALSRFPHAAAERLRIHVPRHIENLPIFKAIPGAWKDGREARSSVSISRAGTILRRNLAPMPTF